MPLLSIDNLVKHFPLSGTSKVVQALNGVSLDLQRGETLGLVGESGSGKTTVGRCAIGLVDPSAGTVVFDGKTLSHKHDVRSQGVRGRIQFVFQEPMESFNPRLSIGLSILEPLRYLSMTRADRDKRLAEILSLIQLPLSKAIKLPTELSPGDLQRAAVGRAMITHPDLVILDEPTSSLDPTARAEIVDLLAEVQRRMETSYLFISHDLSTVRYLSHRVAVLYLGSVMEEGSTDNIYERPRHPYSVGLMASVLLPHPTLKPPRNVKLEGEIPSPIDMPAGCPLASRCPFVEDRCRTAMPQAEWITSDHRVYCYNHEKVASQASSFDNFTRYETLSESLLRVGLPRLVIDPEGDKISKLDR